MPAAATDKQNRVAHRAGDGEHRSISMWQNIYVSTLIARALTGRPREQRRARTLLQGLPRVREGTRLLSTKLGSLRVVISSTRHGPSRRVEKRV